jgi:hypothetical protein
LEIDSDAGPDGATDTDTDVDTDADADTDTGTDTDSETDTGTGDIVCDLGTYSGWGYVSDLADLEALAGYTSISGGLDIIECDSCVDLDDLVCLTMTNEYLYIRHNNALTNIDGLSALTSTAGLAIFDNEALTNLDGLSGITSLSSALEIGWNDALTNIDGLSALTSVDSYVAIWENPALTNLDGLSALTFVDSYFQVRECPAVPDCEACEIIDQLTTEPSSIQVYDNLDDDCTPVPNNCPGYATPCPGYTGSDECCLNTNPCDWALNGICDCASTCAWDEVDCWW